MNSELPALRDINNKCVHCDMLPGDECREDCFTNIFRNALLGAPTFRPSKELVNQISKIIASEIMTYMTMVNNAMKDLGELGRVKVLSRDITDMHLLAEALNTAGIFKNRKQVIDFYKDPTDYEKIGTLWRELGKPSKSGDDTWQMFQTAVLSYTPVREGNA